MAHFNPQLRMLGNFVRNNQGSLGEKHQGPRVVLPKRKLLDYEIFYIREGNGTVYFDDFNKSMKPGDLLLISPMHLHWHSFDRLNCFWVHLDLFYSAHRQKTFVVPAGYQLSKEDESLAQPSLMGLVGEEIKIIRKSVKDKKYYEDLFLRLMELDQKGGLESELETSRILLNLLEFLFKDNKKNIPSKSVLSRIEKVKKYLEANLSEKISLEEMATMAQLAPYYFAHKFKEVYGESPYNYHLKCRLNSAARILLDGEQNVSEVSDIFGFDTVYNFSRVFKKIMGVSPSKYIKAN